VAETRSSTAGSLVELVQLVVNINYIMWACSILIFNVEHESACSLI